MRAFAVAVLAALVLAGCAGNSTTKDSPSETQPISGPAPTQESESAGPESYEHPVWPAGARWTFNTTSTVSYDGESETYSTERRQEALGKHDVEGVSYQLLFVDQPDATYAMPALEFTDELGNGRVVYDGPVECRTERTCLDDPGLAAHLEEIGSYDLPIPMFPVFAGRHMDIDITYDGAQVTGTLDIRNKEEITTRGGTWTCFPVDLDLRAEVPIEGVGITITVTYDVVSHYCPDISNFGRTVVHGVASFGQFSSTLDFVEEVTEASTGEPTPLDAVGRRFTEATRWRYQVYLLSNTAEANGEPHEIHAYSTYSREADEFTLRHTDPDGTVVGSTDASTLVTTFDLPGYHTFDVTLTAPQDVLVAATAIRLAASQMLTGTGTCNVGRSPIPDPADGTCEAFTFEMREGIVYVASTGTHSEALLGGNLILRDAAGTSLATGTQIEYDVTGDEQFGTWSIEYVSNLSLGGQTEYDVFLLGGPTVIIENEELTPTPTAPAIDLERLARGLLG